MKKLKQLKIFCISSLKKKCVFSPPLSFQILYSHLKSCKYIVNECRNGITQGSKGD